MRKQSLDFRAEETAHIMRRWQSHSSCALVGVSGVGKSNLLHHLADPVVVQHYLGWTTQDFRAVIIDTNMLVTMRGDDPDVDSQFRAWSGYELMMHRLYMAFYDDPLLDEDDAQAFFRAYQLLQDARNPIFNYMGLRYLERGLDIILKRGLRLVIMFDEAERLFDQMPAKFFLSLRGLRDRYKTQFAYLTFSRWTMSQTAQHYQFNPRSIESFIELFVDHTHYVGPYSHRDATVMIERMIQQHNIAHFPQHLIEYLLYISGGFASLLRAGFRGLQIYGGSIDSGDTFKPEAQRRLLSQLLTVEGIRAESEAMWFSLTDDERRTVKSFASGIQEPADDSMRRAIDELLRKNILFHDRDEDRILVVPPLFFAYVRTTKVGTR